MKRLSCALGVAVLLAIALNVSGTGAGRFEQKLAIDKQIVHVLNRLTFGPRPNDVAEVRRLGVEKWADARPGCARLESHVKAKELED